MTDPLLAYRVTTLETLFRRIADTRAADLSPINAALRVEAIGFEPCAGQPDLPPAASGILITPWCMSLMRLPLAREDDPGRVGVVRRLTVGREQFDFIGEHQAAIGTFDTRPLSSDMSGFADHEAARAIAAAMLARLRAAPSPQPAQSRPARRSFLFGRGGSR